MASANYVTLDARHASKTTRSTVFPAILWDFTHTFKAQLALTHAHQASTKTAALRSVKHASIHVRHAIRRQPIAFLVNSAKCSMAINALTHALLGLLCL